jgi:hypothetical protein
MSEDSEILELLELLKSGAMSKLDYDAALADEIYVERGWSTPHAVFAAKYPGHPRADPHLANRTRGADGLRDLARRGKLPDTQLVREALHKAVVDCTPSVRLSAAEALYHVGDQSSTFWLRCSLASEKSGNMQRVAIRRCETRSARDLPGLSSRVLLLTKSAGLAKELISIEDSGSVHLYLPDPGNIQWDADAVRIFIVDRCLFSEAQWKEECARITSVSSAAAATVVFLDMGAEGYDKWPFDGATVINTNHHSAPVIRGEVEKALS